MRNNLTCSDGLRTIQFHVDTFKCKIQKNWCTVTVVPTLEHHGGDSTPLQTRGGTRCRGGVLKLKNENTYLHALEHHSKFTFASLMFLKSNFDFKMWPKTVLNNFKVWTGATHYTIWSNNGTRHHWIIAYLCRALNYVKGSELKLQTVIKHSNDNKLTVLLVNQSDQKVN